MSVATAGDTCVPPEDTPPSPGPPSLQQALQPVAAMLVVVVVVYQFAADWANQDTLLASLVFWFGYLVYVFASVVLYHAVPPRFRRALLLLLSVAFAWTAFSRVVVTAAAAHVVAMYLILAVMPRSRLRLLAFIVWMVGFNVIVPQQLLHLQLALTNPGRPQHVLAVLLMKMSWRSVFVYYEVAGGTVERLSLVSLATYLAGLPFLGGQTIALSYRHFVESCAHTPADLHASLTRGLKTVAGCVAVLTAWLIVARVWILPATGSGLGLGSMLIATADWFISYFVWRYACEQGSVGVCRLFGYHIRDDFSPTVLLSKNHMEFWRGWNSLWREFMLAWIYYPLSFRLGRHCDARHPGVIAAAGLATCVADALFDFFPRVLFFLGEMAPTLLWTGLAVLVNHVVWGLLVAASLYAYAARPRSPQTTRWVQPFQIAFTLSTVVGLQVFKKNPSLGRALAGAAARALARW